MYLSSLPQETCREDTVGKGGYFYTEEDGCLRAVHYYYSAIHNKVNKSHASDEAHEFL